jgi:F0F1-type ATP synthase membrane subunit c/vacuolar-type H+-ATPase subunit K
MAKFGRFVLWLLVFLTPVIAIRSGYGLLHATDAEPALKAIAAQCSAAASVVTCVDVLGRVDRLRASAWLSAAAIALGGVGLAFGFGLLILSFDAADGRSERDRRNIMSSSLIVVALSTSALIAALAVRAV